MILTLVLLGLGSSSDHPDGHEVRSAFEGSEVPLGVDAVIDSSVVPVSINIDAHDGPALLDPDVVAVSTPRPMFKSFIGSGSRSLDSTAGRPRWGWPGWTLDYNRACGWTFKLASFATRIGSIVRCWSSGVALPAGASFGYLGQPNLNGYCRSIGKNSARWNGFPWYYHTCV